MFSDMHCAAGKEYDQGDGQRSEKKRTLPPQPSECCHREDSSVPKRTKFGYGIDLALSIQSKDASFQRKIELAFDFATSVFQNTIQDSRLATLIGNWVQPILISWENGKKGSDSCDPCLDFRCWVVLKFCIERASFTVSLNLLRTLSRVGRHILLSKEEPVRLLVPVLECLSSLLGSCQRAFFNAGIDLWVSCVVEFVNVVRKFAASGQHEVSLKLSVLLLRHFSTFLQFHPSPKNIFRVFVDGVLDSLLELLVSLQPLANKKVRNEQTGAAINAVEEVLANGLFHPAHVSGFFILKVFHAEGEALESGVPKRSYQGLLFQRFKSTKYEKNAMCLAGFCYLFRLFIDRNKSDSISSNGTSIGKFQKETGAAEVSKRKNSLFEVFAAFIEPVLFHCRKISGNFPQFEAAQLVETHCILEGINENLSTFVREKIYVPMDDTLDGLHFKFLQETFNTVVSIVGGICQCRLSVSSSEDQSSTKMLNLIAREILLAVQHFVEIEYKVVEDDLVKVWLMIFSFLAINNSKGNANTHSMLAPEILKLCCQLIHVFSELRKATHPIFALCKALRCFKDTDVSDKAMSAFSMVFLDLSMEQCFLLLESLFSSQTFRRAISSSIKSMPEPQASGCINELATDFESALLWMKAGASTDLSLDSQGKSTPVCSILYFNQRTEILGRFLAELYICILDSIPIASSNSAAVGKSVENLVKALEPFLNHLIQGKLNDFDEIISSWLAQSVSTDVLHGYVDTNIEQLCFTWIFVIHFRMHASCKSLYRQSLSLMPPNLAKKAASASENAFVVCSGLDWTDISNFMDRGYFSWTAKPLSTLLDILNIISKADSLRHFSGYSPLIYVLHILVLQRLNDLNRLIRSFNFLQKEQLWQSQVLRQGDKEKSRGIKHLKRCLAAVRAEALGLTNFMTRHLSLLSVKKHLAEEMGDGKNRSFPNELEMDFCVSALTEDTLPHGIWSLLCRSIDVWSSHASKKDLKRFFSKLIRCSAVHRPLCCAMKDNYQGQSRDAIAGHFSLELLRDACFHDQTAVCGHLMSRFSFALKKSIILIVNYLPVSCFDLCSVPDFSDILENLYKGDLIDTDDHSKNALGPEQLAQFGKDLVNCKRLLDLQWTMPIVNQSSKSFLQCVIYILHLERILLTTLLNQWETSASNFFDLVSLFLSCRRMLQHFLNVDDRIIELKYCDAFCSVLLRPDVLVWLLRSADTIVRLPVQFQEKEIIDKVKDISLSLVNHTSSIFLVLNRSDLFSSLISSQKFVNRITKCDASLVGEPNGDPEGYAEMKCVKFTALFLESETVKLLLKIEKAVSYVEWDGSSDLLCWEEILCTSSCLQGFLWGIVSALEKIVLDQPKRAKKLVYQQICRLNKSLELFELFVEVCLYIIFVEVGEGAAFSVDISQLLHELDLIPGTATLDFLLDKWNNCSYKVADFSSDRGNARKKDNTFFSDHSHCAKNVKYADSLFTGSSGDATRFDLSSLKHLKESLVDDLLKGNSRVVAFTIKELFTSCAAMLKLRSMFKHSNKSTSQNFDYISTFSLGVLVGASHMVLQKLADASFWPDNFSFVWIDGILKYLNIVGNTFASGDKFSKCLYTELINLHLKVIGKCILLEGKRATLSTLGNASTADALNLLENSQFAPSCNTDMSSLNAFKSRVRSSLRSFLSTSQVLQQEIVMEATERALSGLSEVCDSYYMVCRNSSGGEISSVVAAGIECFYLILESISGFKQVLKKSIGRLVNALFNIVLHLQTSLIFYTEKSCLNKVPVRPDAGAAVLMCVEVLTTVARKSSFKMDSCQISQCLHIPMALFQGFHQLQSSIRKYTCSISLYDQEIVPGADSREYIVDSRFSVNIYSACCKLLCAIMKQRSREANQCAAVLQESVTALLICLESKDANSLSGTKVCFVWNIQEGIKCAQFFRRIFELVREKKEELRTLSSFFLASFVNIFSGCGPSKSGIKRDIDDALRPGVYSLIDVCSPADLQHLHTVLGDGPCRSTLGTLLQDYKSQFQYEGKF